MSENIYKAIEAHEARFENENNEELSNHYYELQGYRSYLGEREPRVVDNKALIYEYPKFLADITPIESITKDIPHIPRGNHALDVIVTLKRLNHKKDGSGRNIALYEPVKIGRYLKRLLPDLTANEVNSLSSLLKTYRLNMSVKIANDTRLIKAVYVACEDTPLQSCMTGENKYKWGNYFSPPKHPVQVYGNKSGIKLAYIRHNKKVVARTLYSDKNKAYVNIYGSSPYRSLLQEHFKNIGFGCSDYALDGHHLNIIKCDYNANFLVLPYVDGHHMVDKNSKGGFTVNRGGTFSTTGVYQYGTSEKLSGNATCFCCSDNFIDDYDINDDFITLANDDVCCSVSCAQNHGWHCDIDDEWNHEDELELIPALGWVLISRLSDYDYFLDIEGDYHHIDKLFEVDDTYYLIENLSNYNLAQCAECGDGFNTTTNSAKSFNKLLHDDLQNELCSFACLEMKFCREIKS